MINYSKYVKILYGIEVSSLRCRFIKSDSLPLPIRKIITFLLLLPSE